MSTRSPDTTVHHVLRHHIQTPTTPLTVKSPRMTQAQVNTREYKHSYFLKGTKVEKIKTKHTQSGKA